MDCIFCTLLVFHLDISGNDSNDLQDWNIEAIFLTFPKFHLEILGKYFNDEQQLNIDCILITLLVSKFGRPDIDFKLLHLLNMHLKFSTLLVFQLEIFNDSKEVHSSNMDSILVTLLVFHLEISGSEIKFVHLLNI
jgi:hypothetical protein